ALGISGGLGAFLGKADEPHEPLVVVGVTGHCRLFEDPVLLAAAREAVTRAIVLAAKGSMRVAVLSFFAEGADRLVARIVTQEFGGSLRVVLPLEVDDYLCDFETEVSRMDFRDLLALADHVAFLTPGARVKGKTAKLSPTP